MTKQRRRRKERRRRNDRYVGAVYRGHLRPANLYVLIISYLLLLKLPKLKFIEIDAVV